MIFAIAYPEKTDYPARALRRLNSWTADLVQFTPPRSNMPAVAKLRLRRFMTTLSADVTGFSSGTIMQGAEPNFIGLYTVSPYPRILPYLGSDITGISTLPEANPHFIGKYHQGF